MKVSIAVLIPSVDELMTLHAEPFAKSLPVAQQKEWFDKLRIALEPNTDQFKLECLTLHRVRLTKVTNFLERTKKSD